MKITNQKSQPSFVGENGMIRRGLDYDFWVVCVSVIEKSGRTEWVL